MIPPDDDILILDYLEGELDAKALAAFEAKLAQDEPLRLLVRQLASDRALLRSVPAREAPDDLMLHVTQALERQMLADVAPARVGSNGKSNGMRIGPPVLHRFRSGSRWFGVAAAALVALGVGLTWHFDPFGWSSETKPIDVVIHQPAATPDYAVKNLSDQTEAMARGGTQHQKDKTNEFTQDHSPAVIKTFGESESLAGKPQGALSIEAPGDDATKPAMTATPTGKGDVALALANKPDSVRGGAAGDAITPGPEEFQNSNTARKLATAKAQVATASPVFQIELQSTSAAATSEMVFAWAKANDASRADVNEMRRRSATATMRGNRAAESAADADATFHDDAAPGAEKKSIEKGATPGAARAAPAATSDRVDPLTATPPAAPATSVTPAAPAAPPKTRGIETQPADVAAGAASAAPLAAAAIPVRQEITLLVPADRINSLVEHLEAKTGQSFIVVREGDQTLLLSPQMANLRAASRANHDALALKDLKAEDQIPPTADALGAAPAEAEVDRNAPKPAPAPTVVPPPPAPAEGTAPAPTTAKAVPAAPDSVGAPPTTLGEEKADGNLKKEQTESAKQNGVAADKQDAVKQAVKQVLIKIVIVEETK